MGQYYKVVNITKKEFLHPHKFGDGMKLLEFGSSGRGTMMGLSILLSSGNGNGGGDLYPAENPIIGSWAGDKVVICGDYADEGIFTQNKEINLFEESESYLDISEKVIEALFGDTYIRNDLLDSYTNSYDGSPIRNAIDSFYTEE